MLAAPIEGRTNREVAMRGIIVALIVALGLLLVPSAVSAAGVEVVSKTGDGVWTDDTWQVDIYPGETRSTTLSLYNSSSSSLDVEVTVSPNSLDNGNLAFELDKSSFTMPGKSSADVTLSVRASGSATPGTYTTELKIKSEIPPRPSGGGGGVSVDRSPPRISDVLLCHEGVTESTADICWKTHEKSDSQVEYWTSPSMLSELDEHMVIYHHVELTGLTPGTTYHYKTMSTDRSGNLSVSDEYTFTTKGQAPAAAFTTSGLSITPGEVNIGETVTTSATVTNTGTAAGSYKVTLKINGVVAATKEVTLKAGASREVTFTKAKDVAGSYSVDVEGLSGSFTVKAAPPPTPIPPPIPIPIPDKPFNWLLVGGIIAAVVAAAVVAFFWIRRRAE